MKNKQLQHLLATYPDNADIILCIALPETGEVYYATGQEVFLDNSANTGDIELVISD